MKATLKLRLVAASLVLPAVMASAALAQGRAKLSVDAANPSHKISPTLYGIFFEEINCSGDGGIYAELVRNRSFEDSEKPDHWALTSTGSAKAECSLDESQPLKSDTTFNKKSLKIVISGTSGTARLANEGFWGVPVDKGAAYDLSLYARSQGVSGPLTVSLESKDGSKVYGKAALSGVGGSWKKLSSTIKSDTTDPSAQLVVTASQPGTLWLDVVSLFPQKTWKNRPNGLRPDLANMLDGLKPAFVRFPGGCWVEGDTMAFAQRWKTTIGDVAERRTQYNIWNYMSTNGLGYHEYLQMCEDLRAEPLFVINIGMSHREVVPMDKMGEYVQDALDAIEYANGSATSKWGALRAKNGHPKPFNLKYMEIGNENGGQAYQERYVLFHDAIRAKYPNIVLISDVPTTLRKSDVVDEHYYPDPSFFMRNANKYDSYDRSGPKIYVGEYAVTNGSGQGNLIAALGEAAFMTGMERNSDIVTMSSYAPLFANINYKRWNPDLIDFDSSRCYGIPSYYVQQMFSQNRGDSVLPTKLQSPGVQKITKTSGAVGVGTWMTEAEYKDLTVVKDGKTLYKSDFTKGSQGWKTHGGNWKAVDGAFRQTDGSEGIWATVGDPNWSDYIVSVKARKISGAEGFLLLFNVKDDSNYGWVNIGGWGNSKHAIEVSQNGSKGNLGQSPAGSIETGKWYDIKVEVKGAHVKAYIDNKLIIEGDYPQPAGTFFATSSKEQSTGDIILKVVNAGPDSMPTDIDLGNVQVQPQGTALVLTSAGPMDENTIDNPTKVAPVKKTVAGVSSKLSYTFPAYSLTVMRIKTAK